MPAQVPALVLDAGAFIAVDRRDKHVLAQLAKAAIAGQALVTSSAVVAQVLRNPARQIVLNRLLRGVHEVPLDSEAARRIGPLLARTGTSDVVDAALALVAQPGDELLTSDPGDLALLTRGRGVTIRPV